MIYMITLPKFNHQSTQPDVNSGGKCPSNCIPWGLHLQLIGYLPKRAANKQVGPTVC